MKNDIFPCIWFDGHAKAAAEFYCSVFKTSKILSQSPMVVTFELNGTKFMGLNGGPQFRPNEAVSFVVNCGSQEEIDEYWNRLTADGGEESMCGWLKDKFGVSWQIVPSQLGSLMSDPNRGEKVMKELLKMRKLNLHVLQSA